MTSIYMLCFAHDPIGRMKHYLGPLDPRAVKSGKLAYNAYGQRVPLLQKLTSEGIDYQVADEWEFDTKTEADALLTTLQQQGSRAHACSICSPGNRRGSGKPGRPGPED